MRSRLFLKIYLTLLVSLAAVAIASAVFVRIGFDREEDGWGAKRDRFLAEMLPATDDPADIRTMLERLSSSFGADIALYDAAGGLIAAAGKKPPPEAGRNRRDGSDGNGKHPFQMRLPDGRVLAARLDGPWRGGGRNPLAYLALIAATIGLAAYPIVRHLTRRLETLRVGVERFGEGALVTRVDVKGSDEVAAVAASFNKAADRIEKLVTAHKSLLANASHELRSPLARLRMAVDLYQVSGGEAVRAEILQNLGELDQLVEEILISSRLDHSDAEDRFVPVDLLALAAEEAARHGIEVSGSPATINGDAKLLTRLMSNLILNALKHGAPPVEVDIHAEGRDVRLTVSDHGKGIPDTEAGRIFEPFYRPRGRAEAAGGWGLGLALVRQIAERHGGNVRHTTPDGGGTRFIATFPAAGR